MSGGLPIIDNTVFPKDYFVTGDLIAEAVRSDLSEFRDYDSRATESLYRLLGTIFEYAWEIDGNEDLRFDVTQEFKRHPDTKGCKAFNSRYRTSEQLLLTLVMGTKKDRSRMSQWSAVLQEARAVGIERSQQAFVDWITPMGIVDARKQWLKRKSMMVTSRRYKRPSTAS